MLRTSGRKPRVFFGANRRRGGPAEVRRGNLGVGFWIQPFTFIFWLLEHHGF